MLPPNRCQERLRKRFSIYRMHHKACLMRHQNYSASELCLVKSGISHFVAVTGSDTTARAPSAAKRRHRKLQGGMLPSQRSSGSNRNKNLGLPSQMLKREGTTPSDHISTSSGLTNRLSHPSFVHQHAEDLDFVDSLECLLNFGSGVTVLPVLHDMEILDYFEKIAK